MLQKYIFPLKLNKLQVFFRKQVFYFLDEDLEPSNNPYRKSHEKNCSKTSIRRAKMGRFYIELHKSIFIRENLSSHGIC